MNMASKSLRHAFAILLALLGTACSDVENQFSDAVIRKKFEASRKEFQCLAIDLRQVSDTQHKPIMLYRNSPEGSKGLPNYDHYNNVMNSLAISQILADSVKVCFVVERKTHAEKQLVWHPDHFCGYAPALSDRNLEMSNIGKIDDDWAIFYCRYE